MAGDSPRLLSFPSDLDIAHSELSQVQRTVHLRSADS